MSDKGDCRTAPATTGLLIRVLETFCVPRNLNRQLLYFITSLLCIRITLFWKELQQQKLPKNVLCPQDTEL